MLHRVVIDTDTAAVVRFKMPPDYHRAMLGDDFSVSDMKWSPDGLAAGVRLDLARPQEGDGPRGRRRHRRGPDGVRGNRGDALRVAGRAGACCGRPTRSIWNSQRDNWGQLYLYDLATGALKNQITSGEGPVMPIVRVDEKARTVYFGANGREAGQDPYFRHFYRIGLDGKGYASLTPDDGDHALQLSPSGAFLVDTVLDVREPARGRPARRRRPRGDAAREGRHLEAARRRAGSRPCRSA